MKLALWRPVWRSTNKFVSLMMALSCWLKNFKHRFANSTSHYCWKLRMRANYRPPSIWSVTIWINWKLVRSGSRVKLIRRMVYCWIKRERWPDCMMFRTFCVNQIDFYSYFKNYRLKRRILQPKQSYYSKLSFLLTTNNSIKSILYERKELLRPPWNKDSPVQRIMTYWPHWRA